MAFIEAAVRRDIPFDVLPNFIQLGWGAHAERFDKTFTSRAGWIASALALDRSKLNRTLAAAAVPVPSTRRVATLEQAEQAAAEVGWPVVIKPISRHGDRGVVAGIAATADVRAAFGQADELSPGSVLVEQHAGGDSHRLLVVNGRLLRAARRDPVTDVTDAVHPDNAALAVRTAAVI